MNKPPAFQFYPKDFLSSSRVAMMSAEQVGAYILLLAYDWDGDGIPDDDEALLRLSRLGSDSKGGLRVVKGCFKEHPTKPGFLTNERLQNEREKQEKWRKKSAEGGKKSAASRAYKRGKGGSRVVQPKGNSAYCSLQTASDKGDSSESAAKSGNLSPSKRFQPPTLEEVKLAAAKTGLPESEAIKFHGYYESNGWKVGRNKMKSWPHALGNWKARYDENRNTSRNRASGNDGTANAGTPISDTVGIVGLV